MNEPEQIDHPTPLGYYLNIVFRRRWWLIIAAVIAWASALEVSLVLPAKYKSETLVLIEQDSVPTQYVTPNVNIDLQQRLRNLAEQILSRTQLARVVEEDHLYGNLPGQAASEASVRSMRGDITVDLIKSGGQGEVSAFKIAYSALNPKLAQKVTGQLSSLFIQDSLRNQQQLSQDTTLFLEDQLSSAQKELAQQDKLLNEFKSKYLGELPEQLLGNVQMLASLQGRLESAKGALRQAEQQRLALAPAPGSPRAPDDKSPPNTVKTLDEQIDKMKDDLANLSGHYTQRHPDVVHLKARIANAEKAKRQAENNLKSGTTGAQPEGDTSVGSERVTPGSQRQGQMKANQLEIAQLQQEVKDLQNQISEYQARLNLTPLRQEQLAEITRNHEQARANYESLLAKKQQSAMASDMTMRRQGEQFRIIDPPSLPQEPERPNRLKFSGIGLVAGFLIGLTVVAATEAVDARVYSEDDLTRVVQVPVIGTLPPLTTAAERKSQRRLRGIEIAIASVVALLVPAITLMAYWKS